MPDVIEVASVTPVHSPDWTEATRLLEQAVKAGNQDGQALYLLAMAYKHQGRFADARHLLSKIADPDSNVLLQRGILAFTDKDFSRAADDCAKAWEKDPDSYPAAYNLMLARLCLGELDEAVEMLTRLVAIAPAESEKRFLGLLRSLLRQTNAELLSPEQEYLLGTMSLDEEERLLDMVVGLSQYEVVYALLAKLVSIRTNSDAAFQAYIGAAMVQGKQLMDRFQWEEALSLLMPLRRRFDDSTVKVDLFYLIALSNLLGTCAALMQDFERALNFFKQAHEAFQRDFAASTNQPDRQKRYVNGQGIYLGAWLEQNVALVSEWQGRLDQAEHHWNRYFDYLEHYFPRSMPPDYLPTLAFEGCSRLADLLSRKERWTGAISFLQRAHRVRPADYETLERLFHLYNQLRRFDEARRVLRRLREVRPNDPQAELFELEVREVRKIDEVETLLNDLRRIMQRFPHEARVEERAGTLVNNVVPVLERIADQYAGQVNKVVDQMRRLPSYQINWPTVRDIMRDLEDKYLFLRRVSQKCLSHVTGEEARRELNRLITHCDRKIDQAHSLGE
jgi:tetratricopeptide (TPR) repeat protein